MSNFRHIQYSLAHRILGLRKDYGLTQAMLAEKCKLPRSSIARLESGLSNPSLELLTQICDVFDISMSDLLTEKSSEIKFFEKNEIPNYSVNEDSVEIIEIDIDTFKIKLMPEAFWSSSERFTHNFKRIYCESGQVTIIFDKRMIQLHEGEMIEFQSEQKFRISNHNMKSQLLIVPTGSQHPTPQLKEGLR